MTVITDDTVDLIKRWEGLRLEAYRDQVGVWTIGYGHSQRAPLPPKPMQGMRITEEEAESILRADLEHFAEELRPLVPDDLPPHVFGACLSLAFNIGIGAFGKSTCRRRLEAGDVEGAAEALTWWNKVTVNGRKIVSKGLVNRRASEKAFMLRQATTPVMVPPPVIEEAQEPLEPEQEGKSPFASKTIWGGAIALLASVLAGYGYTIAEADQAELVELGITIASAIGGVLAIVGRITASKPIK